MAFVRQSTTIGRELRRTVLGRPNAIHSRYFSATLGVLRTQTAVDVSTTDNGNTLVVQWPSGDIDRWSSTWAFNNCSCTNCRHQSSSQKIANSHIRSKSRKIEGYCLVHGDDSESLLIDWGSDHKTALPLDWLQLMGSRVRTQGAHDPVRGSLKVHKIDFDMLLACEETQLAMMECVNEAGMCVIENTPIEEAQVRRIGNIMGGLQQNIYGDIFDVQNTPTPINIAYSTEALPVHQDLAYYESPPGLQLLHCMKFGDDVVGGESLFVDAFEAAEIFRREHPAEFSDLCRIPATFTKQHTARDNPVIMEYRRTHIRMSSCGKFIKGVHWAPPFEGTLLAHVKDQIRYYNAYSMFAKLLDDMVEDPAKSVTYRLQPGETVIFNNRRVLHGRKAFTDLGSSMRHLQGGYVNIDAYLNQLRVMKWKLGKDENQWTRVGNETDH